MARNFLAVHLAGLDWNVRRIARIHDRIGSLGFDRLVLLDHLLLFRCEMDRITFPQL